jgi:hypothetical protein
MRPANAPRPQNPSPKDLRGVAGSGEAVPPRDKGEQLKGSRRQTRVTTVACRVFASQRLHRASQAVASMHVRVSGRLLAAPVGVAASKGVRNSSVRSPGWYAGTQAAAFLRSSWNLRSVASVRCACSLWCCGARGVGSDEAARPLSTGGKAWTVGLQHRGWAVGLQAVAWLRSADCVGSTIGRLTRRFSGRQVWPAASPAAAELQFR